MCLLPGGLFLWPATFVLQGKGGFLRNLHTHEIVDQVLTVQEDFGRRVSHIVFMGMGEPLLNTDNVGCRHPLPESGCGH